MATINELAREFGAQAYEIEAFYGDSFPELPERWDDELPAEVETTIRDAWDLAEQQKRDSE